MNTSSDGPQISICCEPGILQPPETICSENGSSNVDKMIFPRIYDSNLLISNISQKDLVPSYGMSCENSWYDNTVSVVQKNMGMFMFENGTVVLKNPYQFWGASIEYLLDINHYCFAYDPIDNETEFLFCDTFLESVNVRIPKSSNLPLITSIMLGLALPFLAATFIVYTMLPELRNLHGLILRVYVACRFFLNALFIAVSTGMATCNYALGVTLHFSVLAVFFWLNIMCFDIWWTFRRFRPPHGRLNWTSQKKFIFYSIYAWGFPVLVAGVSAIMESLPNLPQGIIRPEFNSLCWFSNPLSAAIYYDAPLVITLISNAYFFVSTSTRMIQHRNRMAEQFQESSDSRWQNAQKQRFKIYLKLFIVMGITRLYQFVIARLPQKIPKYVWLFINLPSTFEGLAIFIIFVWKDKIKRLLLERLGWSDRRLFPMILTNRAHPLSESNTHIIFRESTNFSSTRSEPITDESCHI